MLTRLMEAIVIILKFNTKQQTKPGSRTYGEENTLAKNLFYFRLDEVNKFGEGDVYLTVCPENFSLNRSRAANTRYRLQQFPEFYEDAREEMEKNAAEWEVKSELPRTNVSVMLKKPTK